MTNEMILERKSNLVMPTHYVELDEEEMCYVDGGKMTYYYGWDGVLQCISCVLFGTALKLGGSTISILKSVILNQSPQLIARTGASSIFSMLGQSLSPIAWVRLALFGSALLAGVISMLSVGSCKIGIHSVFGFATTALYLGAN